MSDTTSSSERDRRRLAEEEVEVRRRRYLEAYDAVKEMGAVAHDVADDFATNGTDVGLLRKLVAKGVSPATIARLIV